MSNHVVRWGVLSTARIGVDKVIPATRTAARCEVVAIASRELARAQRPARAVDDRRGRGRQARAV